MEVRVRVLAWLAALWILLLSLIPLWILSGALDVLRKGLADGGTLTVGSGWLQMAVLLLLGVLGLAGAVGLALRRPWGWGAGVAFLVGLTGFIAFSYLWRGESGAFVALAATLPGFILVLLPTTRRACSDVDRLAGPVRRRPTMR
jgi:hypothetical protein